MIRLADLMDAALPQAKNLFLYRHAETWVEQGIPFLAVRYEDLNAHREPVVRAIFDYCSLSTADVTAALVAFERDSQAGTPLARADSNQRNAVHPDDADIMALRAILSEQDTINTPDYIAPGTLKL